jgi:hypothetical protein
MAGQIGRYEFWTAYRKLYVRNALARGDSRAWIAERLGITRKALNSAVFHHNLKPEPLHGPLLEARADG